MTTRKVLLRLGRRGRLVRVADAGDVDEGAAMDLPELLRIQCHHQFAQRGADQAVAAGRRDGDPPGWTLLLL